RSPFELVAVGLALDQLDQHHRVDAGVSRELDTPTLRTGIDLGDAQLLGLQLEQRQSNQALGRLGQQAETIDHLDLQLLEAIQIGSVGNALVKNQSCMDVR